MGTKTFKIRTCMRGFKKWMDAHPRKNLNGYFSVNGRDMTDAEGRRVVSYAVEKGYETEADIPSEELDQLLKGGAYSKRRITIMKEKIYNYLVAALYGVPSCNYCQHMDCSPNRSPCSRCEKGWSNYKLHKNYAADVRRMARNIVKIAKEK